MSQDILDKNKYFTVYEMCIQTDPCVHIVEKCGRKCEMYGNEIMRMYTYKGLEVHPHFQCYEDMSDEDDLFAILYD